MKVRALTMGIINGSRRRAGDEFELPDEEAKKLDWVAPVGENDVIKADDPVRLMTLSEVGKAPAKTFEEVHSGKPPKPKHAAT